MTRAVVKQRANRTVKISIEAIAKRNGMETETLRKLTYSQVCCLDKVGKKTASLICNEFNIPMVPTKKEVISLGDKLVLFHREKGKRAKYHVWDFPDVGMVPTDHSTRTTGRFQFFRENLVVKQIQDFDMTGTDTLLRACSADEIRDMAVTGPRPVVHERVLQYLERRGVGTCNSHASE